MEMSSGDLSWGRAQGSSQICSWGSSRRATVGGVFGLRVGNAVDMGAAD